MADATSRLISLSGEIGEMMMTIVVMLNLTFFRPGKIFISKSNKH